jgi:hypothetical protein
VCQDAGAAPCTLPHVAIMCACASLSLSVSACGPSCVPVCLSLSLSACGPSCVPVCLSPSLCLRVGHRVCLYVSLPLSVFLSLSVCVWPRSSSLSLSVGVMHSCSHTQPHALHGESKTSGPCTICSVRLPLPLPLSHGRVRPMPMCLVEPHESAPVPPPFSVSLIVR